ncbi:uncharacterized protein LOC110683140 [Chenopodium quinoa]|uniref:uncharacterized protein LOC110683140 n=1 Tax=Chenopodium quinoa TaxID=63459 RepID=UPI000B76D02F|nr:uncharacterized protein LOC110683140 [Chenopodium quinoa]
MEPNPVLSSTVHTEEDLLQEEAKCSVDSDGTLVRHVSPREYYAYKLLKTLGLTTCNQQTIRADLYQGILDTVESGETSAINVGRRVILPPTFIGGPRDMKWRYLKAMSLVQRFGKPDLFVTMTCDANCPEIKIELATSEAAQNCLDIVAIVFHSKLICLKEQIMKKHVFGKVAAMIYVVEFQKRGLPHAYFLIILKEDFKIKTPTDFDQFVCAKLPPQSSSHLQKIIVGHMMHGSCGRLNR